WPDKPSGTFTKIIKKSDQQKQKRVTVSFPDGALVEIVKDAFPNVSVVPTDPGVDLKTMISIMADNMSVSDFIKTIEGATGYGLEVRGDTVYVSSYKKMQWNAAALASTRNSKVKIGQKLSGGTEKDESTGDAWSEVENNNDAWDSLLDNAKAILGASESDSDKQSGGAISSRNSNKEEKQQQIKVLKPFVIGMRSLGIISAAGAPYKIDILDEYIRNYSEASSKQINIDVKMYDVTLNDERAAGIDWNALARGTLDGKLWSVGLGGISNQGLNASSSNVWSMSTSYEHSRGSFESMVRFLAQYGTVDLVNQPNITTLNGSTAFLSTGDEFSYIADIETVQDDLGNIKTTPKFDRLKVGVTLSVTPRLLDGERILLDIVPVVSSVQGSDSFTVEGYDFNTPIIALQELSTQVITRNGEPIQLGGLITKKVSESLTYLPWKNKKSGKLLSLLFDAEDNDLQRRELVITVVPRIVETGKWKYTAN
ncbi:MAG: hypothetical protein D6B27_12935, partial [Gammaproteobacteria bacterium]